MRKRVVRVGGGLLMAASLFVWSPFGPAQLVSMAGAAAESEVADPTPADLPAIDAPGDRAPMPEPVQPSDPGLNEVPKQVEPEPLSVDRLPDPAGGEVDVERSSPTRLVWQQPDGSFAAELTDSPKWFQAGDGSWSEIDVSLEPMKDRPGWLTTTAGAWSARFGPISPEGGGVEVIDAKGQPIAWRPSERSKVVQPEVAKDGLSVTYREMWPGVDLVYRLSTFGVREEMVIAAPEFVRDFAFDVDRAMVRDLDAERVADEVTGAPEARKTLERFKFEDLDSVRLSAPVVVDRDGLEQLEAPVVSRVERFGSLSRWTVGVDAKWAGEQPAEAYPLVVDPDLTVGPLEASPTRWLGMKVWSGGWWLCGYEYQAGLDFCWPRVGNSNSPATPSQNRTIAEYNTAALLGDEAGVIKTVQNAGVLFEFVSGDVATRTTKVYSPTTWDWAGAAATYRTQVDLGSGTALADVEPWVNKNSVTKFSYLGEEHASTFTYKSVAAGLFVTWTENHLPSIPSANFTVPLVRTTSNTSLTATVSDPDTNGLKYTFEVARSPGFESGTVVDTQVHGWTASRSVTRTMSGLKDGTSYWARVKIEDQSGVWSPVYSAVKSFRVDMRLGGGGGGVAPMDTFGPIGVNLATGNVTTSVSTTSYPIVGGSLGLAFTYNSLDPKETGVLPPHWTMSGAQADAEYSMARLNTGASTQGGSVTLTRADGSKVEFLRKVSGGSQWFQTPADVYDSVTVDSSNNIRVSAASGLEYLFAPINGTDVDNPLKQMRQISDVLSPASPTSAWDSSTPPRLTTVTDPVSTQAMTLVYGDGTDDVCPPPDTTTRWINVPAGMLCKVTTPGGQTTKLHYSGSPTDPRLARVENPGQVVTDFAYGTGDTLTEVRTPTAADVEDSALSALNWADGSDSNGSVVRWKVDYTSVDPVQATKVWSPVPKSGGSRLWREYDYSTAGQTTVIQSGAASDYATVYYDDAGRPTSTVTPTPTGTRTVAQLWDTDPDQPALERVTATADTGTGLMSTTEFDQRGRPIAAYGPAPIASFAPGLYPAGVRKSVTNYDEGLTGLEVRAFDNNALAGTPVHASLNFDNTNGLGFTDWGTGAPSGLVSGDGWSARMTGDISFTTAGTYNFQVWTNVGYRVWINNQLVLDQWADPDLNPSGWTTVPSPSGTYNKSPEGSYVAAANSSVPIRVEIKDETGRASFALHRRLLPSTTFSQVTAAALTPQLGLPTSVVDADGHVARTSYSGGSVSPVFGLPASSTTETSPANLVESYEYETTYLRRTGRTLPGGVDTKVTYQHAGALDVADSPCDSATNVPQAGRQTRSISATSGAAGDAMTYATFYDALGRAQGTTSGAFDDIDAGTTDWVCTEYDARGRSVTVDYPAFGGSSARTVNVDYAVGGNPLVGSATDPAGTTTTEVDLLGRSVTSTDVWGVETTTDYDTAGRPVLSTVAAGATSFSRGTAYDSYSRATVQELDGDPIANVTYDDADRMTAVSYPSGAGNAGNGTSGAFAYSSSTGDLDQSTWTQSNSTLVTSDQITERWLTGHIRDQATDGVDPNGTTDNYSYDGAWRLTGAVVPEGGGSRTSSYSFAATGGCGDLTTAGENSNRTSKTVTPNGGSAATVNYCYDNADRLTSTTDTSVGTLGYDDHGNTVTLGNETHVYDAANRHLATTQAGSHEALLIVGNPSSLSQRDTWMRNRLLAGDWTVTTADDDSITAGSATGKQVVVISESVGGTGLATTGAALAGVAVPIVSAESYIFDELGMTGTGSNQGNTTNSQDGVDITAAGAAHPLGAGLAQGNVTTSTSAVIGNTWGKPNANAVVAATIEGDATKATIFGYDTAATMVTGTAAARRVGFMYYGGNGTTYFNDNAAKLFDAAVQWAAQSVPYVKYQRDAADRIVQRSVNGIVEARYAQTASGDTPSLMLDATGTVTGASLSLPGGVLYQWIPANPTASKWDYPNLQGNLTATASSVGIKIGATRVYDPDGNQVVGTTPDNGPGQLDYGWLGSQQRPLEHQGGLHPVIEMGARQYHPGVGRFLEIDPIEGGVHNDYGYVADPVNESDTTGAYRYTFGLSGDVSATQYMAHLRRNCSDLFAIAGCRDNFQVGNRLGLFKKVGWYTQSFPVSVAAIWATGFEFVALAGHPEGEGRRIRFEFTSFMNLRWLIIESSGPGSAIVNWVGVGPANNAIARETWAHMVEKIDGSIASATSNMRPVK